jgi:hypothetical protein
MSSFSPAFVPSFTHLSNNVRCIMLVYTRCFWNKQHYFGGCTYTHNQRRTSTTVSHWTFRLWVMVHSILGKRRINKKINLLTENCLQYLQIANSNVTDHCFGNNKLQRVLQLSPLCFRRISLRAVTRAQKFQPCKKLTWARLWPSAVFPQTAVPYISLLRWTSK